MKLEYTLKASIPELGSDDNLTITVNLDSNPGIESIVGNFYRFLLRIGVEEDVIREYIYLPELDEEDLDEDEKEESFNWERAKSSIVSEVEKSILQNSSDEKKKEEFLKRIKENPEFSEEVFKTFLSSILKDDADEVQ